MHVTILWFISKENNNILYPPFVLDFEKKWRLEQYLWVPMQFTQGSRYLHVHIVTTDLRREINLIPNFFSSRIFFSLDFISFMMEAWDNCTDGRRTNWGIITMRVEEWEKQENKWVKKTPTGGKNNSYQTREVTSRTEMQATENGMSSREKLDPLSQGRKKKKHTSWKATGGNGEGKA